MSASLSELRTALELEHACEIEYLHSMDGGWGGVSVGRGMRIGAGHADTRWMGQLGRSIPAAISTINHASG